MHCPFCRHPDSRVVDSRASDDGSSIRRRRQCPDCGRRFTTVETATLMVEEKYQNFAQGPAYAIAFLLVMVCIACLVVVAILRPQDEN